MTQDEIVTIEAGSDVEATLAVDRVMNNNGGYEIIDLECAPGAKTTAYKCTSCGDSSRKTEWGPGWNRCPRCGERGTAPAVSS